MKTPKTKSSAYLFGRSFAAMLVLASMLVSLNFARAQQEQEQTRDVNNNLSGSYTQDRWRHAHDAYAKNQFTQAAELFGLISQQHPQSQAALFNAGNSLFQSGKKGEAIAAYLRALKLAPRNQALQSQLAWARSQTQDELALPHSQGILFQALGWLRMLRVFELQVIGLIAWSLLWLMVAFRYPTARSQISGIAFGCMLAATGFASAALAYRISLSQPVAVVTTSKTHVRAAPNPNAAVRFALHEGAEIAITHNHASWLQVELPQGVAGWMPQEHAQVVTP